MGSGMFPVETRSRFGEKLSAAASSVESICEELDDGVYSGEVGGMQFDNVASDGASLALLRLAAKLIRAEVSEPKP